MVHMHRVALQIERVGPAEEVMLVVMIASNIVKHHIGNIESLAV